MCLKIWKRQGMHSYIMAGSLEYLRYSGGYQKPGRKRQLSHEANLSVLVGTAEVCQPGNLRANKDLKSIFKVATASNVCKP